MTLVFLGNLVDEEGIGSENISKQKLNRLIKNFIELPFRKKTSKKTEIPLLEISIPYNNLKMIYKDRQTAIKKKFSRNQNWTKGIIKYKNKKFSTRIRLKGLLSSHWEADKRFSLRFKLKNKESILGMNGFSLHKLRSRQYPYEYIFQEILSEFGLSSTNHKIVKVKLNGVDW